MARQIDTAQTISAVPGSITTSGIQSGSSYMEYAVGHSAESPYSSTNNAYASRSSTGYAEYSFDFSDIPSEVTIQEISVVVAGHAESTTIDSTHVSRVQLYSGSTAKGASQNFTSTSNQTITISDTGTWTLSELQSAKLRHTVGYYGGLVTGVTWTVTYAISGYMYEITATSNVTGYTVDPASQEIFQGGTGEIRIDGSTLTGITVTDNNTDIINSLQQHQIETGGTQDTVLGSYTLVSGGFNGSGASYFSGLVGAGIDHTKTTSNYYSSGSGTIAVFTYNLVFDNIPSNATITALTCQVNGHAESTSNSSEYMCAQLICGSTELSEELNFKSIGTSNSTQTLTATILPTVSQLSDIKLQCKLGYYGGAINGATATITYTVPSTGNDYYWTYTISNIAADHTIVITSVSSGPKIYFKTNGDWVQYSKVYIKQNGTWVEQPASEWSSIFSTSANYVKQ